MDLNNSRPPERKTDTEKLCLILVKLYEDTKKRQNQLPEAKQQAEAAKQRALEELKKLEAKETESRKSLEQLVAESEEEKNLQCAQILDLNAQRLREARSEAEESHHKRLVEHDRIYKDEMQEAMDALEADSKRINGNDRDKLQLASRNYSKLCEEADKTCRTKKQEAHTLVNELIDKAREVQSESARKVRQAYEMATLNARHIREDADGNTQPTAENHEEGQRSPKDVYEDALKEAETARDTAFVTLREISVVAHRDARQIGDGKYETAELDCANSRANAEDNYNIIVKQILNETQEMMRQAAAKFDAKTKTAFDTLQEGRRSSSTQYQNDLASEYASVKQAPTDEENKHKGRVAGFNNLDLKELAKKAGEELDVGRGTELAARGKLEDLKKFPEKESRQWDDIIAWIKKNGHKTLYGSQLDGLKSLKDLLQNDSPVKKFMENLKNHGIQLLSQLSGESVSGLVTGQGGSNSGSHNNASGSSRGSSSGLGTGKGGSTSGSNNNASNSSRGPTSKLVTKQSGSNFGSHNNTNSSSQYHESPRRKDFARFSGRGGYSGDGPAFELITPPPAAENSFLATMMENLSAAALYAQSPAEPVSPPVTQQVMQSASQPAARSIDQSTVQSVAQVTPLASTRNQNLGYKAQNQQTPKIDAQSATGFFGVRPPAAGLKRPLQGSPDDGMQVSKKSKRPKVEEIEKEMTFNGCIYKLFTTNDIHENDCYYRSTKPAEKEHQFPHGFKMQTFLRTGSTPEDGSFNPTNRNKSVWAFNMCFYMRTQGKFKNQYTARKKADETRFFEYVLWHYRLPVDPKNPPVDSVFVAP